LDIGFEPTYKELKLFSYELHILHHCSFEPTYKELKFLLRRVGLERRRIMEERKDKDLEKEESLDDEWMLIDSELFEAILSAGDSDEPLTQEEIIKFEEDLEALIQLMIITRRDFDERFHDETLNQITDEFIAFLRQLKIPPTADDMWEWLKKYQAWEDRVSELIRKEKEAKKNAN
ncbi:MAG: hypothetical protein ACPLSK_04950, partial [bacterium]